MRTWKTAKNHGSESSDCTNSLNNPVIQGYRPMSFLRITGEWVGLAARSKVIRGVLQVLKWPPYWHWFLCLQFPQCLVHSKDSNELANS